MEERYHFSDLAHEDEALMMVRRDAKLEDLPEPIALKALGLQEE